MIQHTAEMVCSECSGPGHTLAIQRRPTRLRTEQTTQMKLHHGSISVYKLPQIYILHNSKWGKSGVGMKLLIFKSIKSYIVSICYHRIDMVIIRDTQNASFYEQQQKVKTRLRRTCHGALRSATNCSKAGICIVQSYI